MSGAENLTEPVVGEWILKSARFDFADETPSIDIYGSDPVGRLMVTAAGRFTAILMAGGRAPPAAGGDTSALFNSMMVYSGACAIEGDTITVQVDLAQHPAWVGTEQVRHFAVEGDDLKLFTSPMSHPGFSGRMGASVFRWVRAA